MRNLLVAMEIKCRSNFYNSKQISAMIYFNVHVLYSFRPDNNSTFIDQSVSSHAGTRTGQEPYLSTHLLSHSGSECRAARGRVRATLGRRCRHRRDVTPSVDQLSHVPVDGLTTDHSPLLSLSFRDRLVDDS